MSVRYVQGGTPAYRRPAIYEAKRRLRDHVLTWRPIENIGEPTRDAWQAGIDARLAARQLGIEHIAGVTQGTRVGQEGRTKRPARQRTSTAV